MTIPKPDFTCWTNERDDLLPPKPKRKKVGEERESSFSKLHDSLQKGNFKKDKVAEIARGSYFAVYSMESRQDRVLKAFHGSKTGFTPKTLKSCLRNSISNYKKVAAAKLQVATIFNAKTAVKAGYLIQKKISNEVNPKSSDQIKQIAHFFAVSVERGIEMDLQPANFRLDGRTVYLVDFVESPESVAISVKTAIRAWVDHFKECKLSRKQSIQHLRAMTESFLDKYSDYPKSWLDELIA